MRLPAAHFVGQSLDPDYLAAIEPIRPDMVSVEPVPTLLRLVWGSTTRAMTLGSRVYVDPDLLERGGQELAALLLHEMVHARQWLDDGAFRFVSTYLRQYLFARLAGASHRQAYRAISAEVEARRLSAPTG